MACLADTDDRYGYTVAWLDCLATGAALGRSVITSGDFAAPGDLPAGTGAIRWRFTRGQARRPGRLSRAG